MSAPRSDRSTRSDDSEYLPGDPEGLKHQMRIPANDYASSWACRWTLPGQGSLITEHERNLLRHVNCSYLSSEKAPTLLVLKQHAQSLAILIRKLSVSQGFGIADADNNPDIDPDDCDALRFRQNESFDWLNNLEEPYTNDDLLHWEPLYSLRNDVRGESDTSGLKYHCPLAEEEDAGSMARDGKPLRRPRMTHHALTMHANECLEILDHELGAAGGLMSLLPTDADEDDEEMAAARNTLLGQWLLHQQHLVGRMHELEINYANALDALAGEAVVPAQLLSRTGFEARSGGRQVAYPQDRYVLVNAGDDVTKKVHEILDEREWEMEDDERMHRARGVSGDRMWEHGATDDDDTSGGLVAVDVVSRFYRVKGQGHDASIFLIPAFSEHDGVVKTRDMENKPTVVSVATPRWPRRVSEWEKKYRGRLDKANEIELDNKVLMMDRDDLANRIEKKDKLMKEKEMELKEAKELLDAKVKELEETEKELEELERSMEQ